jgi:hypothetical protein
VTQMAEAVRLRQLQGGDRRGAVANAERNNLTTVAVTARHGLAHQPLVTEESLAE